MNQITDIYGGGKC